MDVNVFKKNGEELILKNVKYILTNVVMGETVTYYLRIHCVNHIKEININDISGFEIHHKNLSWIDENTDIICPHCNSRIENDIFNMMRDGKTINFCPICGQKVEYSDYANDIVEV